MYHAAVLTVSDRSFRGERPDTGGPLVAEVLRNAGYDVVRTAIVPDEQPLIEEAQGRPGESGGRAPRAGPWAGDALRQAGRLRRTEPPRVRRGGFCWRTRCPS